LLGALWALVADALAPAGAADTAAPALPWGSPSAARRTARSVGGWINDALSPPSAAGRRAPSTGNDNAARPSGSQMLLNRLRRAQDKISK
jgi:hypothetical protein